VADSLCTTAAFVGTLIGMTSFGAIGDLIGRYGLSRPLPPTKLPAIACAPVRVGQVVEGNPKNEAHA
jgi:hypothetical protein